MSTALAIAATTRVLSSVIQNWMSANGAPALLGNPTVTTKAPDQLEVGAGEEAQLSLLLYRVTYNQGWREVGLPTRNGSGAVIDRPPLPLDLHYLLVAYGSGEYEAQMMLGLGMQALHEIPVLYGSQIDDTFTPPAGAQLSPLDAALAEAGLSGQIERIKVTPEPLTTEDISKLWTAFGGKFRPSAAYEASVVLIESKAAIQPALPVRKRNIAVIQYREPSIDDVAPQRLPVDAVPLRLTLTGTNLTGDGAVVVFDGNPGAPQAPQPVGADGGTVTTALPPNLRAGVNTLRVVKQVVFDPSRPATSVLESNVSVFYLEPVLTQDPAAAAAAGGKTVTVTIDPPLGDDQKVQLLLNELAPPDDQARAFTYDGAIQANAHTVTFATAVDRAGDYLVRVRVDGAESELAPDYSKPKVTL